MSTTNLPPEVAISSLAYIDICRNNGLNYELTVLEYLARSKACSDTTANMPTLSQINSHLDNLGRKYNPDLDANKLINAGTKILFARDDQLRATIQKHVQAYDMAEKAKRSEVSEVGEGDETELFKTSVQEMNALQSDEKTPQKEATGSTTAKPEESSTSSSNEAKHHPTQATRPIIEIVQSDNNNIKITPTSKRNISTNQKIVPAIGLKGDDVPNLQNELYHSKKRLAQVESEWQKESYELSSRLEAAQKEIQRYRQKLAQHQNVKSEVANSMQDPTENKFTSLIDMVTVYKRKLDNQEKLFDIAFTVPKHAECDTQSRLITTSSVLATELDQILQGPAVELEYPNICPSGDLQGLLNTLYGEEGRRARTSLKRDILKYGSQPEIIIASLISAALQVWVFQTSFPSFEFPPHRLLEGFREILSLQYDDDPRPLCLFETAAFNLLAGKAEFRDVILPRQAWHLSQRLISALESIFRKDPKLGNDASTGTWGQSLKLSDGRHARIMKIFHEALQLKTSTVTISKSLRYVIHPPGNLIGNHNPSLHQNQNAGFSAIREGNDNWVVGTLQILVKHGTDAKSANSVQTPNYTNFIPPGQVNVGQVLHTSRIQFSRSKQLASPSQGTHSTVHATTLSENPRNPIKRKETRKRQRSESGDEYAPSSRNKKG